MYKYLIVFLFLINFVRAESITVNKHESFAHGFNNVIEFTKDADINQVRVFFKDSSSKTYELYVKTKCISFNCYGKLPQTVSSLQALDYTIVYRNVDGYIHKTDDYTMNKEDLLLLPSWQKKHKKEKVVLYSEFEVVPNNVKGFGGDLVVLPTPEDDIFGIEVGLYFSIKNGPKKDDHKCKECNPVIIHDSNNNYAVSNFIIEIIEKIDRTIKEMFETEN